MIKPLPGYILVKPIKEDNKAGGIYLPEDQNDKPSKGVVVDCSNIFTYQGNIFPITDVTFSDSYSQIKKGVTVIYKKWTNQEVKYEGEEYLLVKYDELLGIIK